MQKDRHLVWLIVLGLLLAACASAAPATTAETAPAAEEGSTQEASAMEPQTGGTVVLTTGDDFQGAAGDFDGNSTHDDRLMPLYLDTLMLGKQDGTLEPRLAESITLADDGLTWTISLRTDALWHDGEPIVADDVVYVLNTMCSGQTNPPSRLNEYATIVDCEAYSKGEADGVSGVTKVDNQRGERHSNVHQPLDKHIDQPAKVAGERPQH